MGGGAADGVRGVGEAVDEGIDVVGRVGARGWAGAAMAASVALWGVAKQGIAAGLVVLDGSHDKEGSFRLVAGCWRVVGGGLAAN